MLKTKMMGALALTALMGLGAIGPVNAFAEAHALNAPVANSAQQKTVVSTTDNSDGVISYKDKASGKNFVSEDNGATWCLKKIMKAATPQLTTTGGPMMSTKNGWNWKRKIFKKWRMSTQWLKPAKAVSSGHRK